MPPPHENAPSTGQGVPSLSRIFRWLSRALFVAAVLAALAGVWLRRHRPADVPPAAATRPAAAAAIIPSHEALKSWASAEDGVSLRYPELFDAARGFGEYTARTLQGGLRETDLAAFRCGTPRSVVTVHLYRAPRPMSWGQWRALAEAGVKPLSLPGETPDTFASRFGGPNRKFSELEQAGRPMLDCEDTVAESTSGALEVWSIRSRLVAEGDRAARITVGAPTNNWRQVQPLLRQVLESFCWDPPHWAARPPKPPTGPG